MIVSIASGKGGTGKTTVAVNLAQALGGQAQYIDCDVEEPNGHLFLKPKIVSRFEGVLPNPVVDPEKCTHCGECQKVCQFNALISLPGSVLFFKEFCHGCGACYLACPEDAVSEKPRRIGVIEKGSANEVDFVHGVLDVGEAMASPLIKQVKEHIRTDREVILDAPPGTSCPVIESIVGSDVVVLVTEPTPFGLHDLSLAVEVVDELGLPAAVVINRSDLGDLEKTRDYCARQRVPVILEIPFDRRIAETYSKGGMPLDAIEGYREKLLEMYEKIEKLASPRRAGKELLQGKR